MTQETKRDLFDETTNDSIQPFIPARRIPAAEWVTPGGHLCIVGDLVRINPPKGHIGEITGFEQCGDETLILVCTRLGTVSVGSGETEIEFL